MQYDEQFTHLVKVLHLVPVTEPGLLVLVGLDDEDLVIGEHLSKTIGEDLPYTNVQLVHLHLLLITLHLHIFISTRVLFHIQLLEKNREQLMLTGRKRSTAKHLLENNFKILILKEKGPKWACPELKLHYHFAIISLSKFPPSNPL